MLVTGDNNHCVPPDWYYRQCMDNDDLYNEDAGVWDIWWWSWWGIFYWGGWGWGSGFGSWGSGAWGYYFSEEYVTRRCELWYGWAVNYFSWLDAGFGAAFLPIQKWDSHRWLWTKTPLERRNRAVADLDDPPEWEVVCDAGDYVCSTAVAFDDTSYPFIWATRFYETIGKWWLKCRNQPVSGGLSSSSSNDELRAVFGDSVWSLWWSWFDWWWNGLDDLCGYWWEYYTEINNYPRTPIGGTAVDWSGAFYVCAPFKRTFHIEGCLHALGQVLRITISSPCVRDPDSAGPYESWSRVAYVYGRLKPNTGTLTPCTTCKKIKFKIDWTVDFAEYMIWRKQRPWAVSEPLMTHIEVVGQFWPKKCGVRITTTDDDTPPDDPDDFNNDGTPDDQNTPDPDQFFPFPVDVDGGTTDDDGDGNPIFPDPNILPPVGPQPPVKPPVPPNPHDHDTNPCCCNHALGADGEYHGRATLSVQIATIDFGWPVVCEDGLGDTRTAQYGNLNGTYNCVADCTGDWSIVANLGQHGNSSRRGVLVEINTGPFITNSPQLTYCWKITTNPLCDVCPTDAAKVQLQGSDVLFYLHTFDATDTYINDPTTITLTTEHRVSACKDLACDGTLVDLATDFDIFYDTHVCNPDCSDGGAHGCKANVLIVIDLNVSP